MAVAAPHRAVSATVAAAHRFGLGEATLAAVGADPRDWLMAQIGPADPQKGSGLASLGDGLRAHAAFAAIAAARRRPPDAASAANPAMGADIRSAEQQFAEHFRPIVQADVRAHLATAVLTQRPFAERLALFWSNHFTVSAAKASTRALVGAFDREAIRPHIAGNFGTLLKAAVTHGSMLRYLDNDQSAGPNSRVAGFRARRVANGEQRGPATAGLNENLAREVLELHTLGAASQAYTQADVTALAAVLTGWRLTAAPAQQGPTMAEAPSARFDPAWHEPGPKTVMGRSYDAGARALDQVLADLVRHPATARFVSLKLARHFVADEPPAALVDHLAREFSRTEGDLPSVYRALIGSPQAWEPVASKLKTPAEFVISTHRLLGLGEQSFARNPDGSVGTMGQRLLAAPSPAGWPDRAEEWLGPDAVWKRVEWATRVADRLGRQTDARALARAAFGPALSESTAQQLDRAADGPQALALLLLSPEFQRR